MTIIMNQPKKDMKRWRKYKGGVKTVPIYEYECRNCSYQTEKLEVSSDEVGNTNGCVCPVCGGNMRRLISLCQFKLEYNNKTDICDWQGNTSQYWKAYKDAKARGEDVKPYGED
jgi:putative FmdB family regulatory protein